MIDHKLVTIDDICIEDNINCLQVKPIEFPYIPTTRYQGSKRKILPELATALSSINYTKALDMFCGSGVVSLLLRALGKNTSANDFLLYNQNTARVFLSFDIDKLNALNIKNDLNNLLYNAPVSGERLVSKNYTDIYFIDSENDEIDRFCQNIHFYDTFAKSIYIYAVGQALMKKRPYNLFHRANLEMRTKEVKRSFGNKKTWETPIIEHAIKCINELKKCSVKKQSANNFSITGFNSAELDKFPDDFDLVYLDPPYINGKGAPVDYSNFYHFLEGLCDYSLFNRGDNKYPHKPIVKKPSAWLKRDSALAELTAICEKWPKATIVFSYRSDGLPTPEEAALAMSTQGRKAEIHSAGEYKYALSKTDTNEELFILAKPLE
ncbi:DNA adenine methylase [Aeromonas hydrophila]|uniref:DNA adenine methylase n=1 Tax=Aeromonas hydrophila TaxID=644 RepID=UPI001FC7BD99|nr:DNA adenine methylase [Aeromonas hydrophila]GKQ97312.1 (2Fe-2S)-binding protein [Aeromonas hydrophila]